MLMLHMCTHADMRTYTEAVYTTVVFCVIRIQFSLVYYII